MVRLLGYSIMVLICLGAAEVALRLQQWWGPLYDLEARYIDTTEHSDVVNHRPRKHETSTFVGRSMYGEHEGFSFTYEYDEHGIRQPVSSASAAHCARTTSFLFMGDSFIEGYDIANTVPDRVVRDLADRRGICSTAYNAGVSSYSPAIFVPLARQLLQVVTPEYVVIGIDETDLGDDVYRYEELITRNAAGENVGVRVSPLDVDVTNRLIAIRSRPLYLQRIVEKLYTTKVFLPRHAGKFDVFTMSRDHEEGVEVRYAAELAIFRRNLGELIDVLSQRVARDRIIFIHHPHLQNLVPEQGGQLWNNIVSTTVAKVAAERGVRYFDATPALRQAFADHPEDFYWRGDMHFTFEGLQLYAASVAAYLAEHIR